MSLPGVKGPCPCCERVVFLYPLVVGTRLVVLCAPCASLCLEYTR